MSKFADRLDNLKVSEIREILKVTENPEIISFAGGLPAPELFPVEEIKRVNQVVLEEEGQQVLQYTTTEGYRPLREWISDRMLNTLQARFNTDEILITHGSQQGLDLSGKVFLNKGDIVLCESPSYLAAISAFKSYECEFIEIPTDDDGMDMVAVEEVLRHVDNIKIIYVIPDFQNPTGKTWGLNKRKILAKLAAKYDVMILEDNPYAELRFEGESLPSIQSFDTSGHVICLGTFSKIFCPGYRIGWVAANVKMIQKYILVKQAADLQCNTIAQREIYKYLCMYDIDGHIERIRKVYKERRDLTIRLMEELFPEYVIFTRPKGGLFIWVELPEHINARDLLEEFIEMKVAVVPGGAFFPNGGHENTFRINFSNMPNHRIEEGIKRLSKVLNRIG